MGAGKDHAGRLLTFNGAGKGLAGNFYAGKVNAGNNPRTIFTEDVFEFISFPIQGTLSEEECSVQFASSLL